jgi:hypothetical protein
MVEFIGFINDFWISWQTAPDLHWNSEQLTQTILFLWQKY